MHGLQQVIIRLMEYAPKRRGVPREDLESAVLISSARNPYYVKTSSYTITLFGRPFRLIRVVI